MVRGDELNLVGVSVVVADGGVDPITIGWVGVNDGHGEGVFVGMLTIGSLNDRRYQRLSRVQHDDAGLRPREPPSSAGRDVRDEARGDARGVRCDGSAHGDWAGDRGVLSSRLGSHRAPTHPVIGPQIADRHAMSATAAHEWRVEPEEHVCALRLAARGTPAYEADVKRADPALRDDHAREEPPVAEIVRLYPAHSAAAAGDPQVDTRCSEGVPIRINEAPTDPIVLPGSAPSRTVPSSFARTPSFAEAGIVSRRTAEITTVTNRAVRIRQVYTFDEAPVPNGLPANLPRCALRRDSVRDVRFLDRMKRRSSHDEGVRGADPRSGGCHSGARSGSHGDPWAKTVGERDTHVAQPSGERAWRAGS